MSLLGYLLLSWALFNVLFAACFLYPVVMSELAAADRANHAPG
jgi:hypothetical protein